jgi:hypothetical protein
MNASVIGAETAPGAASRRETSTNSSDVNRTHVAETPGRRLTRSEKRRRRLRNQYNREYMRRWRATPKKKSRKKRCRRGSMQRGMQGRLRAKPRRRAKNSGGAMCGICRRQRAICVVTRFQTTQDTESGFRAVRVPYCGVC